VVLGIHSNIQSIPPKNINQGRILKASIPCIFLVYGALTFLLGDATVGVGAVAARGRLEDLGDVPGCLPGDSWCQ